MLTVWLVNTFGSTATCVEDDEKNAVWSIFLQWGNEINDSLGGLLEGSASWLLLTISESGWRAGA
jgi:hypothetical protein